MYNLDTDISNLIDQLETSKDEGIEVGVSSDMEAIEKAIRFEEYKGKKQDREQRKDFAERIFQFLMVYMLFSGFVLVLSGIAINNFHLNDEVLITLLGTTTANVIGIFVIVAKYLFPQHKD